MRVFLSWSGQPSRQVASALREWLRLLFPPTTIDPWMSEEDISMGSRWSDELNQELEKTEACIVCLTPENTKSTWLHFEAGKVAKVIKSSLVCPFLVGVQKHELVGPLSGYQAATALDRKDTLRMVRALNTSVGTAIIQPDRLEKMFEVLWPQLEAALKNIDLHPEAPFDRVIPGISSVIHSSALPMFFMDHELNVKECNDRIASLLNTTPAAIIGQPVRLLLQRFADRVPSSRRTKFLENNLKLAEMMASELGPHLEAEEYIDNRDLFGNPYRGLWRVRIHADKIQAERSGSVVGVFIIYFLEKRGDDESISN